MRSLVLCVLTMVPAAPTARLHVALAFDHTAPPSIEMAVAEEAARIWAAYGIELDASLDTAPRPPGTIILRVSIGQRRAAGASDQSRGSIAFNGGMPQPRISLYVATASGLIATATPGRAPSQLLSTRDRLEG